MTNIDLKGVRVSTHYVREPDRSPVNFALSAYNASLRGELRVMREEQYELLKLNRSLVERIEKLQTDLEASHRAQHLRPELRR